MNQDILNQILTWVSLFVGVASLALAIYTISLARNSEKEIRESFVRQEDRVRQQYERVQALLSEIDKRSAVTETVVRESQDKLLNTLSTLLHETAIPKQEDMGEKFGMMFMQQMMSNPKQANQMLSALQPLIEMSQGKR